ncbi:MAG: IS630 family transposase [Magnetococcales bacterium]|nr:IS630 family transposase [Magnetococcales bacterium]
MASIVSPESASLSEADSVQTSAQPRWTVKRLVALVQAEFGQSVCRETIRKALKRSGLSWKKAKKLLGKADPKKRAEFLESLKSLLEGATWDKHLLIYLDEAHIHQDSDLGYGWSIQGERLWVTSSSPGLSAKVSFYGLYLYNEGQVRIWPYERANGENTVDVLRRLRDEFPDQKIKLIWDGASYHRSILVKSAAMDLKIDLVPLPGYSPDFMPVESLWHWLREDVTYFFCHSTSRELIDRVTKFQDDINQTPCQLADRLWVKDSLDPEVEKLRIPK